VADLNYAGEFDATLSADGAGTHDSPVCVPADAIVVPDAHLLFNADFMRSGVDLILSKDDRELVLHDYFKGEKRAALSSPDGAHLTGNIVNALTGQVEHAQAGGEAAEVIGHIQTAIGSGTLTRACGIAVQAKVGAPVCQGDVIEIAADGRVGLRFIDGTAFNLSGGARMVLDEFVCDSNGTSHSALFGVTRGTFDFIVGQVAKTGCLRIDTPVGSIRGRARTGGIGMLSLTGLIFSVMKEVQAVESSHRPLSDSLDDDNIKPKDLQLNGVVELFMRDGRHYTLDDPAINPQPPAFAV
jgi:fibronectin-binding autotransporter adhesin